MAKQHRIPGTNSVPLEEAMRQLAIPPNLEWDPDNPMVVNACSGHSEAHSPDCDQTCPKVVMDEFDIAIENERREWARVGMDMKNYSTNLLRIDVQIQTIIAVLEDKLGMTNEDFNTIFKPRMLAHMQNVREQYKEAVKSARTRSNIIMPGEPLQ